MVIAVFSQMFAKVSLVIDVQRLQSCGHLVTSKDLKGIMCRLCKMASIIHTSTRKIQESQLFHTAEHLNFQIPRATQKVGFCNSSIHRLRKQSWTSVLRYLTHYGVSRDVRKTSHFGAEETGPLHQRGRRNGISWAKLGRSVPNERCLQTGLEYCQLQEEGAL